MRWVSGIARQRNRRRAPALKSHTREVHGDAAAAPEAPVSSWSSLDQILERMENARATSYRYVYLLRQCGLDQDLPKLRKIHQQIQRNGFDSETFLGNVLIEMYIKCGSVEDAKQAFERIQHWNSYSFTLLISAHAKDSYSPSLVPGYFQRMMLEGLKPQLGALRGLVASCGSFQEARAAHACAIETEYYQELGNTIVSTYLKFGELQEARSVFEKLDEKGLFAWTALIGACAQAGRNREALRLFHELDLEGLKPDTVTFINTLSACSNLQDLAAGRGIHSRLESEGLISDVTAANALVNMYSRCRRVDDARDVFLRSEKNESSWNTMISVYAREELSNEATVLFQEMLLDGTKPNEVTFIALVGVCGEGFCERIHECVASCGLDTRLVIGTALVTMYGKFGRLQAASEVFWRLGYRNVITWNTIIGVHAEHGRPREALMFQRRMELEGVKQDKVTFICLLEVCSDLECLSDGEAIHSRLLASGYGSDPVVNSALVNMYTKCNKLDLAREVFDSMTFTSAITWTTLIAAYAQQGLGKEALKLFHEMDLAGVKPDEVTYLNVLGACSRLRVRTEAEVIRLRIAETGIQSGVLDNNLVNMYSKVGDVSDAQKMFDELELRDVCSCTTMISAYAQHGREKQAVELYRRMNLEGLKPDDVTHVNVLEACARVDALDTGKLIHQRVIASGSESDVCVVSSLINMYGKCGDLVNALAVFEASRFKTVVTWNSLLTAFAQKGRAEEAIELYQRMIREGEVEPNEFTFVAAISACCELGSLAKGRPIHEKIRSSGLETGTILATALINMYGKFGCLAEARDIFDTKSSLWNVVSWNAMIVAYAQNGHEKDGLELYQLMNLEGVEPNGVTYTGVLFACAHGGMLEEACRQFVSLKADRGIERQEEHYSCIVDLMGRMGRLEEAEEFVRRGDASGSGGAAWLALLKACEMHGDLTRGKSVSREAMERNPETSSSYVLLSNMYKDFSDSLDEKLALNPF